MNDQPPLSPQELASLKLIVGPAVKPLHASRRNKRRIREELLAHVVAVYRDELAQTHDGRIARERTRHRFGDPAAIAAELQPTISRWSRADAWIETLSWQPGDSTLVFMTRLILSSFLVWFSTLIVLTPLVLLIPTNRPLAGFAGVVVSAAAVFGSASALGIVFLSDRIGRGLFARRLGITSPPASKLQTAIWFLFSLALFPALAYLIASKTDLGNQVALRHAAQALYLAPFAPALFALVGYKMMREELEELSWQPASDAN